MADNDIDISKTHLNQAEQVIKLDFYRRLQNTENFASNASRSLEISKSSQNSDVATKIMKGNAELFTDFVGSALS